MKRYIRSAINPIDNESLAARLDMAEDFTLSRRDLQHLADNDSDSNVRRAALSTLEDIDDVTEMNQMRGPDMPSLLRTFSRSSGARVRWQIAQHPDVPIDVLQKLANDIDTRVRKVAQDRLRELGL